ncbi:hypothetical protein ACCD10_07500 [Pseudomonas sp. Pseusp122]|uniref:DUF6124 family protein n=1 Tax=unclassified Pseudomonas TaxID=196821 RepID=UPI0039A6B922
MKKIVPDPPVATILAALACFEERLNHASDLLNCANATTYEAGDNLQGQDRALVMASTHLIAQTQGLIEQMIDYLPTVSGACRAFVKTDG